MVLAGLLFATPTASLAASASSTDSYQMAVKGKVKFFKERVAQLFDLKGTATIESSSIGDVDRDGSPDIATEILSMNITGTTTAGLAINLNSSKSNRSTGKAETIATPAKGINSPNLLLRMPVASFFDVFPELSVQKSGSAGGNSYAMYGIQKAMRLQGTGKNLSNLSGTYTQRKSGSVIFLDSAGNPAGTLTLFVTKLNFTKSN